METPLFGKPKATTKEIIKKISEQRTTLNDVYKVLLQKLHLQQNCQVAAASSPHAGIPCNGNDP